MNVAEWLYRTARRTPDAPAIYDGFELVCDYAGFATRAAALSKNLVDEFGLSPGDRVAIFAKNQINYLVAMYGIWQAGMVAVPINGKLHAREAAWILADSGASLVFVTADTGDDLSAVLSDSGCSMPLVNLAETAFAEMTRDSMISHPTERSGDDLAWLFYTSGTTGRPKGVMITHGNIRAMALSYFADVDSVSSADAALYAAPISHGAGIYNFMHVMKGARNVVPRSGGFAPVEIFDLAKAIGSIHMFAAPTMVRRLIDHAKAHGETGEGIRSIVYGGGPMYLADIVEAVDVLGDRFVQIFGQGESPMCITALSRDLVCDRNHPRWRERLQSVGTAQSVVEVAVFDEGGNPLSDGEVGEVVVRGPTVMKGYWNNAKATAETLRDGWLWTGDMGVMDAEGFLTLKDRSKDLIISGGSNIYPREVEEALLSHPGVGEASVIGKRDGEWGEIVFAFIVRVPGQSLDDAMLDAHCKEHIARFKRPKEYRFVDALPKNNYGKVLKTALREMLKA